MKVTPTAIADVLMIEPDVFRDERGFFLESYHKKKYQAAGINPIFVQDNHSLTVKGGLRGMHFQFTMPQNKLIRVLDGEIMDVAVDIRRGSPTFKKWTSVTLSAENKRQLFIPAGFAHGFFVTGEKAEIEYKCSDFYNPSDEGAFLWNDPEIGIKWPAGNPVLSPKDKAAPLLKNIFNRLPVYKSADIV